VGEHAAVGASQRGDADFAGVQAFEPVDGLIARQRDGQQVGPSGTTSDAPRPSTRPTQLCDQSPDARFWTRASRHRPTGARGAEAVETFTATTGQLLDTLGLSPEIDGAGALLTRSG